jgi:uncharacterized membrane protein
VLALGAAFFFSVLMFSMVIVIAMIGLLYALLGSRNVKSGEDQVIEGERVFEEDNKNGSRAPFAPRLVSGRVTAFDQPSQRFD